MTLDKKKFTGSQSGALFFLIMAVGTSLAYADTVPDRGNVEIDGFKGIRFGMSRESAVSLGLKCEDEGISLGDLDSKSCSARATLFGEPASIFVLFRQNKVTSIHVEVIARHPVDLATSYTNAYGMPSTVVISNPQGYKFRVKYWLSRSGTSIQLATPVADDGITAREPTRNDDGAFTQKATYYDMLSTKEFLRRVEVTMNPDNDF